MCDDSTDVLSEEFRDALMSGQPLGGILLDYAICVHCQHVYKESTTPAHLCPKCKRVIETRRSYGPITTYSLINLIQDHYRMELSRTTATGEKIIEQKEARHHVGILLLFCTFVECWMGYFLRSLMVSRSLPELVIDRMLADNWRLRDRRGKLFKTLTEKAFGTALRELTDENKRKGEDLDYEGVWQFVENVLERRNDIIHEGAIYSFPEQLAEKCIKNIHSVNGLFVSLHNQYIVKRAKCGNPE